MDGQAHRWAAEGDELTLPPLELAQVAERAFRRLATRRILVHRLELHLAWGLGRARSLFEPPRTARLNALEPTLARLRRRYPQHPVLPGWARAAEAPDSYRN